MKSNSVLSFLNGTIAGAGAVLAIMAAALLKLYEPLELSKSLTTTEIRVAIFLGAVVFAIAISYEFYLNNTTKKRQSDEKLKKDDDMFKDETKSH